MAPPSKVPFKDRKLFVECYENPRFSHWELRFIFNCCNQTIRRYAKSLGLPLRRDLRKLERQGLDA